MTYITAAHSHNQMCKFRTKLNTQAFRKPISFYLIHSMQRSYSRRAQSAVGSVVRKWTIDATTPSAMKGKPCRTLKEHANESFFHPVYRTWILRYEPDKATKLLWIYAPASYGKTVLYARAVECLTAHIPTIVVSITIAPPFA